MLVRGYAHVFVLLSVVIITLPQWTSSTTTGKLHSNMCFCQPISKLWEVNKHTVRRTGPSHMVLQL